jgi:putative sulfotransferase
MQREATSAIPPVFVVGTGRCGSTLVSNILRTHPEVLSLSEFFTFVTDLGTLIPLAFPAGIIDATHFWRIISTCYHKQNLMLRAGVAMDEVLYPCAPTSRFHAETGVPAILQTTLPHLTPEHDLLFDEVRDYVLTQPPAGIQQHYTRLFEWLQQRFQRRVWVERSGSSIRIIERLRRHFPHARFVHIVRDGRNCALSMSKHYGFRMVMLAFQLNEIMGCDPFEDDNRAGVVDLPDDLYPFLPEHFDPDAFRAYDAAPSLYGHYWSGEIIQGLEVLSQLPAEQVLTLHYEDFLNDCVTTTDRLIRFIEPTLADDHWLHQIGGLIHPARSAWEDLPEKEKAFLQAACAPGFAALEAFERAHSASLA